MQGTVGLVQLPNVRWNDGTSWPIEAGHNCIACASPQFWGTMSPFYSRLNVPGFGADTTAETVGLTGIQPACTEIGTELSAPVAAALESLIDAVTAELYAWEASCA